LEKFLSVFVIFNFKKQLVKQGIAGSSSFLLIFNFISFLNVLL